MPRSFDLAAEYGGGVEQVHSAFSDERYWLARLANSGADTATLDTIARDDDGNLQISTTQALRRSRLPAWVTQFHRGDVEIVRHETWGPLQGAKARADVAGTVSGAPVTLTGSAVLTAKGAGSRLMVGTTVEVRIPLVGGTIENLIGVLLGQLVAAEQRFTTAWLEEA